MLRYGLWQMATIERYGQRIAHYMWYQPELDGYPLFGNPMRWSRRGPTGRARDDQSGAVEDAPRVAAEGIEEVDVLAG